MYLIKTKPYIHRIVFFESRRGGNERHWKLYRLNIRRKPCTRYPALPRPLFAPMPDVYACVNCVFIRPRSIEMSPLIRAISDRLAEREFFVGRPYRRKFVNSQGTSRIQRLREGHVTTMECTPSRLTFTKSRSGKMA